MTPATLRSATIQDLPVIVELKLAMFAEAGLSEQLADQATAIIRQDYQQLYAENRARHYVVEQDGVIVAMTGAFLKSDLPFSYYKTPVYGFIGDVYTRPIHRGQGFARRLNQHALGWLKTRGASMVRLLATEAGRPLYEALGFKPSGEMVLYFDS
jgi:GNAT superfamily N-acetyltransferase